MTVTMRPISVARRKKAARPSSSEPCFHTIAPRLENRIMRALIEKNLKDGYMYTTVGFNEDENKPPEDNPHAATYSWMWWNSKCMVLTETLYKIENPPDD